MKVAPKNKKILQLNKYAREYIENCDIKLNYQNITEQMKDFSGAEYVVFNIFEENGKDFTLVGLEGNRKNINKAMDIIGYNVIGKKFKYEKSINDKSEKSIVTEVESLKELLGNVLPSRNVSTIEKIFNIDSIITVRITKKEKTIGNFALLFSKNQNKNDNEMLKLFASQVGLFIDKKISEKNNIDLIQGFKSLSENSLKIINAVDNRGNHMDPSDSIAKLLGTKKENFTEKNFKEVMPEDIMNILLTNNKNKDFMDKKEVIRKLIDNGNRLRSILKTIQDGFWIVGENEKIIFVNDSYCKMSGYSREEILNSTISDFKLNKNIEEIKMREQKILKTKYELFETKHIKKNGEVFDVKVIATLFKKEPLEFLVFFRNITEKKKNEQKITHMNTRLKNIIEGTNAGTWEWNIKKDNIIVNSKYADILGYQLEEILPMNIDKWEKLIHHDDLVEYLNEMEKIRSNELEYYDVEYRMKHKNGKKIWLKERGKITRIAEDGNPILISGAIVDITEKKKNEQKILDMNIRLANIIEGTNAGTWELNVNKNIVTIDEKYAKIVGYEFEELSPLSYDRWEKVVHLNFERWKKIVHPKDFYTVKKEIKKLISKEIKNYDIEIRIKNKTGEWIWINPKAKVTKWSEDGKPLLVSGIINDISDKKKAEKEIYNEREKFKTTLLSVGDGVISTDKKGKIKIINNVAEKLTGWSQKEAYNKPLENVLNIIDEYTRQICENPAKKALNLGKIVEMANHTILINKYGKEIPIEDSAAPIKDKDGNITGAVIVFRDFTEKREKQKEIEYLSFNDHLTGLYNRRYMEDYINRMDTERNMPFSIIAVDINGLKLTNDAYGHEMGDKLLITVSKILKKSCRKEDIISRVGGDEFLILLPNVDEKKSEHIIERITEESQNTKLDSVIISLSLGSSTKKSKDKEIAEIYKEADNKMYRNKIKNGKIMRNKTIEKILLNINNKYNYERIHSERVSQYCLSIARARNLSNKEVEDAKIAGSLHDIGKIIVSPEILNKKDKLDKEEWEEVKKHPYTSYQLLKSVDEYANIAEAVLYHHEKLDGSGYPEGLRDDEIPLLSKIISVADAYEAMTANRSYQKKKTKKEAIKELKKYSGTQFDEEIVKIFINKVL